MTQILGIDVGATGIKGALVDIEQGELISDRVKYKTPKPATPDAMMEVMKKLVEDFEWQEKVIGIGFPAIIKDGHTESASNIHKSWKGYNLIKEARKRFSDKTFLINDADAAGISEMRYGLGRKYLDKVAILLTLGTGIGSAIFNEGELLPNTELGHLKFKSSVAEKYASNSAREGKDLSWKEWAKELNEVLNHINFLFSPDVFILGGGISKKFDNYEEHLDLKEKVFPAESRNNAGIIGAALHAYMKSQ